MQHNLRVIKRLIGNILFCALGFFSCLFGQDPVLRIVSMQGKPVESVQKQTSFIVEVQVAGGHVGKPTLPLPENASLLNDSIAKTYSMVNGVMSQMTIYRYIVSIAQEGSYSFGPATIQTSSGSVATAQKSLKVTALQEKKTEEYAGFFSLPRAYVYVSEIIPLRLQVTIDPVNVQRIDVPHLEQENFKQLKPWTLQKREIKKIDNQQVLVQEWVTDIQCTKPGVIQMPIQSLKALVGNGFFMSMFASQTTIPIKPFVIECLPLPTHNGKPVAFLGDVHSMTAKMLGNSVDIGNALSFELNVEYGQSCIVQDVPTLHMPDGVQCYFSQESNQGHTKKFTYIIHPTKEGTFTIPKQECAFFNPVTQEVGTLLIPSFSFEAKKSASVVVKNRDENRGDLLVELPVFEFTLWQIIVIALLPYLLLLLYGAVKYIILRVQRRSFTQQLLRVLSKLGSVSLALAYDDIQQVMMRTHTKTLHELLRFLYFSPEAIHAADVWWDQLIQRRFSPIHDTRELSLIIKQWIERYG